MNPDEQNEAGRDPAGRRAARARLDDLLATVLDGLQLEQLAQYPGHQSGPHWVTTGALLARIIIRWWPHP